MLDLKVLTGQLQAKCREMEAADKAIEGATTDEAKSTAREVFKAKSDEFDVLKAEVEKAKAHQARLALTREIEDAAKPAGKIASAVVASGIGAVVGTQPAQARDHSSDAHAHREAFTKWMQGKDDELSSGERALLEPTSDKVRKVTEGKESDAKKSVVIPPTLAAKCLGGNYARAFDVYGKMQGKTILSLNDATLNPSLANNLVPQEFRTPLNMLPFDEPTVLNKVTMIPSVTGNVTFPGLAQTDANEFGGVAFTWTQEGGEKQETEPVFNQLEIPCYELSGYTEISERALSRSAIPLEALLVSIFKPALNYTLDGVIINGSGTAQPTGIVNSAGVRTVARAAAGAVSDSDLVALKHLVKPVHRGNAMFALEDSVEEGLELAVDGLNRPLFRASTANGPYDRLVGFPYAVATNCPALGTQGDVIFGNMKWYFLVMEEEITIARSEHYKFQNNVVCFKVFVVVGGRVMQPRAFSMLADAAS